MTVVMVEESTYSSPVLIDVDELDMRPASDMRVNVDMVAVSEFEENHKQLPAILVARDADNKHWIVDGYLRLRAWQNLNRQKIWCRVINVRDYHEAFRLACHSNQGNTSVRITNADKTHRVKVALRRDEISIMSNRDVAEFCGVTEITVRRVKIDLEAASSRVGAGATMSHPSADMSASTVLGRDGKFYPAKLSLHREELETPEHQGGNGVPREASHEPIEPELPSDLALSWGQTERSIIATFGSWPEEWQDFFVEKLEILTARLVDL